MLFDQESLQREIAIVLFSILVPLGVYIGRMNVRASRREIVRDLERLFQFANKDGRPLILPSFSATRPRSTRPRSASPSSSGSFPTCS